MVEEIKAVSPKPARSESSPKPATRNAAASEGGNAIPQGGKAAPVHLIEEVEAMRSAQVQQRIRAFLTDNNRALDFRVDGNSGRTVITVFNKETGEVVRQIPPEELLGIAQQFGQTTAVFVRAIA